MFVFRVWILYVFQGSVCFVLKCTDEGIHYDHSGIAPLHMVDAMAHYLIAGRDLCVCVCVCVFAVQKTPKLLVILRLRVIFTLKCCLGFNTF